MLDTKLECQRDSTDQLPPIDPLHRPFVDRLFPGLSPAQWHDWRWQWQHRLTDVESLGRWLALSADEREALAQPGRGFPVSVTPYYASLLPPGRPHDPLRRTMLPSTAEARCSAGEDDDPLAEEAHTPLPGIVHRYRDRALFLVSDTCPVYCRYCTRARRVGTPESRSERLSRWAAAVAYLAAHAEIRDVLVSGGEPLLLEDEALDDLLGRLRAIRHIEIIRIGTKVPMVLPQRVTPALTEVLRRFHPLYMSLHATHPRELTPSAVAACEALANVGVPLRSQTVLLRGVNDDADTLRQLMHGLLQARVSPYYLLQIDPVVGSAHFRTPVARGIELLRALRGHTSGYAVPHFIVDTPGGGGKIAVEPPYIEGRDGDDLLIRNYEGRGGFRYHDPPVT